MSLSRSASPSSRARGNACSNSTTAPLGSPSLRMMIPRSVSAVTSPTRSPRARAEASTSSACFRGLASAGSGGGAIAPAFAGDPFDAATPSTRNSRGPSRWWRRASGHRDRTRSSSSTSAGSWSSGQINRPFEERSPTCSTNSPLGSSNDRRPFPAPRRPISRPRNPPPARRARIIVAAVEQRPCLNLDLAAGDVADPLPLAGVALAAGRPPDDESAAVGGGRGLAKEAGIERDVPPVNQRHPRRLLEGAPARSTSRIPTGRSGQVPLRRGDGLILAGDRARDKRPGGSGSGLSGLINATVGSAG